MLPSILQWDQTWNKYVKADRILINNSHSDQDNSYRTLTVSAPELCKGSEWHKIGFQILTGYYFIVLYTQTVTTHYVLNCTFVFVFILFVHALYS